MLRDRHAVTVSAASPAIRIALSEGQTRRRRALRRDVKPLHRGHYPAAGAAFIRASTR